MSESDKKSIAALLYVTLRRTAHRVIDVEWLGASEDYAREVIRLARQQGSEELAHYADRYEELVFGKSLASKPILATLEQKPSLIGESTHRALDIKLEDDSDAEGEGALPGHYIGSLR